MTERESTQKPGAKTGRKGPIRRALNKWSRKLHRWGAIVTMLPVLIVIATGLILQLKKDSAWVQPPTAKGVGGDPAISFQQILDSARTDPQAGIESWDDVDRLDVRPSKGIVKVRAKNRWEVQIDTTTEEVVKTAYRRSDLIESIHDGSFFADWAKLWIFLPSGVILLALWVTGMYLWIIPVINRGKSRKKLAGRANA